MMTSANLVGFVIGLNGVSHLFGQLFGSWEGSVVLSALSEKKVA
jgi:hypothetical protein